MLHRKYAHPAKPHRPSEQDKELDSLAKNQTITKVTESTELLNTLVVVKNQKQPCLEPRYIRVEILRASVSLHLLWSIIRYTDTPTPAPGTATLIWPAGSAFVFGLAKW